MYIKVINGVTQDYTIGQLRKDNPTVSFPRQISEETLNSYDVFSVVESEPPTINERTQKLTRNSQANNSNGSWVYEWTVTDKTAEEISEYDNIAANSVRAERDLKLKESDWVTVKAVDQNAQDSLGIQVPQVWLTYRQALRDITQHANFPHLQDTDWPETP